MRNLFMSHRKNRLLFRVLILFIFSSVAVSFTSNNLLERLISGLAQHKKSDFQEKIYLHFDNPYYIAGEDIFFKGYLTDAYNNTPGGISKAMKISIYDTDNKEISSHKYIVKDGFISGTISLPDTLKSGNYTILSYTNWMRNYDENYFFRKEIQIYGSEKMPRHIEEKELIDLQFFPEGGQMVNDLLGKIAFKATNNFGLGIKVSGQLFDDNGNKITDIISNNLGMGAFKLKPSEAIGYYIKLNELNKEKKYKLPIQVNNGLVLAVNNLSTKYIEVDIRKNSPSDKYVLIVLQSKGDIHYYSKTLITSNGVSMQIPKNNLKSGISQLTVFDVNTELPLAERLVFIDGMKPLNIKASANKKQFGVREKVSVKIKVDDQNGKPIHSNFSMSISNRDIKPRTENIYSYLLLSSELKGNIENPNYYFQNNDSTSKIDLDYLMLTQGWRRFIWKDILNPSSEKHQFTAESGMFNIHDNIISGGKPVSDEEVSILLLKQLISYQSKSNENGILDFTIQDYTGDEIIIYLHKNHRNKIIEIDNTTYNLVHPLIINRNISTKEPKKIKNFFKNQLINLTYHNKLQKNDANFPKTRFGNNYSNLYDKSIVLSDYITFLNMPEFFKEVVANVSLRKNKAGKKELRIYSKDLKIKYSHEPLYLINGKPTFNTNVVLDLDISIVKSIGIIHSPKNLGLFGEIGRHGVLAINTSEEIDKTYETNIVKVSGYNITKEFYQPKYENEEMKNNTIPDFRSVLYWNPNVITDENGEAVVEFYTSDEISNYSINIEGISPSGQIGSLNQKFINVTFPISIK